MRLKHAEPPLRRTWSGHPAAQGLLLEKDVGVGHGRLKAKLLVFARPRDLQRFWPRALHRPALGRRAKGAVNQLCCQIESYAKSNKPDVFIEADKRYFCVIGLVKGWCTTEVIAHEAVHAAFAFAKRKSRCPWDTESQRMDEEAISYPAGRITSEITRALEKAGL